MIVLLCRTDRCGRNRTTTGGGGKSPEASHFPSTNFTTNRSGVGVSLERPSLVSRPIRRHRRLHFEGLATTYTIRIGRIEVQEIHSLLKIEVAAYVLTKREFFSSRVIEPSKHVSATYGCAARRLRKYFFTQLTTTFRIAYAALSKSRLFPTVTPKTTRVYPRMRDDLKFGNS